MVNDQGQVLNAQQVAAIQAQQFAAAQGRRSRPSSPGLMQAGMGQASYSSPQHNGFLAAYDGQPILMNTAMAGMMPQMGQYGGGEGYLSDHSEIARGRSPRGRRGSSKPPEDPTDPSLLQDIPAWLRTLRLHKYTDVLKDLKWDELVQYDDKALEARGVNALGARNKMLKVCTSKFLLPVQHAKCSARFLNRFEKLKPRASWDGERRSTGLTCNLVLDYYAVSQKGGSSIARRLRSIPREHTKMQALFSLLAAEFWHFGRIQRHLMSIRPPRDEDSALYR